MIFIARNPELWKQKSMEVPFSSFLFREMMIAGVLFYTFNALV